MPGLNVQNISSAAQEQRNAAFQRHLPVSFNGRDNLATWVDLSHVTLKEPFYNHEISRLAKNEGWTAGRTTSWDDVINIANIFEPASPSAVIFHVSRCGSTLLTNLFRGVADGIALSEAAPVNHLNKSLHEAMATISPEKAEFTRCVMRALVTLYTRLYDSPLVIKAHTASILRLREYRSIWPDAPFIINVREPVEVLVSNMEKPADWARTIVQPSHIPNIFGFDSAAIRTMSLEEYCARAIGEFYGSAVTNLDENCSVIDYQDIGPSNIEAILEGFGLNPSIYFKPDIVRKIFAIYSKDWTKTRDYVDDRVQKHELASAKLRKFAEQWAYTPYLQLLNSSAHQQLLSRTK